MKKFWKVCTMLGAAAGAGALYVRNKKQQNRELTRIDITRGVDCGEYVTIGGIQQYLYHRGQRRDNPVMLFLHGGPGSPELPLLYAFQTPWEDRITVVHWDQRGSGKTYFANNPEFVLPTTTTERLLDDVDEIVKYLKEKYHKEKIIIFGHSWGSALGSQYVKRHPESVLAYIGVGQVVNMQENERVGYEKVLEAAQQAGNQDDYQDLLAMQPYPGDFDSFMEHVMEVRRYQNKYKLASGINLENAKLVLYSPYYTLKETTFYLNPKSMQAQKHLMRELFDFDLASLGLEYQAPVFYIQGTRDWQTPFPLAKEFFPQVQAPIKEFFPIEDAGHDTMLSQPQAFNQALFSILDQVAPARHAAPSAPEADVDFDDTMASYPDEDLDGGFEDSDPDYQSGPQTNL